MKTEIELEEIFVKNSTKLNWLCRVCLTEDTEKSISLFDARNTCSPLSEKIMLCARVKIQKDDGLPSIMCEECSRQLDLADHFRTKCEYSDAILRRVFLKSYKCNGENTELLIKSEKNNEFSSDCDFFSAKISEDLDYAPRTTKKIRKKKISKKKSKIKKNKKTSVENDESQVKMENNISSCELQLLAEGPLDNISIEQDLNGIEKKVKKRKMKKSKGKDNLAAVLETNGLIIKEELVDSENLHEKRGMENNDSKGEKTLNRQSLRCHLCDKPLSNKYTLEKHIKSMHGEERKRKGITVSGYGPTRRYHCSECAYLTPRSQNLVYHMRIHTGEKPYCCQVCNRSFTQPKTLNSHLKTHSDKMDYTCSECGKQFKHREVYVRHKNVHSDIKKYTCSICDKSLKSVDTLKAHMNRHYNIKNFSCELCGGTFVTRVELINHSKQHSDEKKFACTVCEYRTNVKKNLEKHILRHTGERSFKCEVCEHACYTMCDLKIHMRRHTKEKNYSCPLCEIKFSRTTSVNRHMLKFHGIKYKRNADRRFIK